MFDIKIKPKKSELLEDDEIVDLRTLDTNITIDYLESKIKQRETPILRKFKVLK